MPECLIPEWQRRRSCFSHDWLKNQFLPALAKWRNVLDDKVEDPDFEQLFVSKTLPEWQARRLEAIQLVKDFEQEMSPVCHFNHPLLARCTPETKAWLAQLLHNLWMTRYAVQETVAAAMARIDEADEAYKRLIDKVSDCPRSPTGECMQTIRHECADFLERCLRMASAIETFPSRVRVT